MRAWLGLGIAILVLGFVIGWFVAQPGQDWRTWKAEVERYQRDTVEYLADQALLRSARDAALARADSAERRSDSLKLQSDRDRALRLASQKEADKYKALLAQATTPADSLLACMGELLKRRDEASACAQETSSLRGAIQQDSVAIREKTNALALEVEAHDGTRARLRRADSLLATAKAPPKCGVPLCAALSLDLEPWDRTFFVGVSIPIRTWIRAGAVRRVTK